MTTLALALLFWLPAAALVGLAAAACVRHGEQQDRDDRRARTARHAAAQRPARPPADHTDRSTT
ncbi:hypothetical protein [Streptomyces sp. NPDC101206]|uniref:hypothetical protein n=1 Tax=Streptomyces sp. NPDC101206 TaxID=3366128 RepID=UPI003803D91D